MSRVLVQGLTGGSGQNFAENMRRTGTNLVAGVRPGRGGTESAGVPVFDTVAEAVAATGASASVIAVPATVALAAAEEAIDAGVRLIVIYAEGVPVHDALRLRALSVDRGCTVVGPNSAGVMSPGRGNLSDMRSVPTRPGPVGVISRSGTLAYEVISDLDARGIGITTVICTGGDPVVATTSADAMGLFLADDATRAIVLVGEPGGSVEIEAARRWAIDGRRVPLTAADRGTIAAARPTFWPRRRGDTFGGGVRRGKDGRTVGARRYRRRRAGRRRARRGTSNAVRFRLRR